MAIFEVALPILINLIVLGVGVFYVTRRYIPDLIQNVLEDVGENLSASIKEIFVDPTVKKGFSLAGKLGGDARSVNIVSEKMAQGAIDQQLGGLKMVAKQLLGIDIDEMVEEYGATTVLQGAQKLLPMLKGMVPGAQNVKRNYDPLA